MLLHFCLVAIFTVFTVIETTVIYSTDNFASMTTSISLRIFIFVLLCLVVI